MKSYHDFTPQELCLISKSRLPFEKLRYGSKKWDTGQFIRKGLLWDIPDRKPYPIRVPEKEIILNDDGSSLTFKSNYHLPQVWANYLNQFQWDIYGHLTFRNHPHPERCVKTFELFIHKINRKIYGVNYWKHKEKGITWACATELQKRGIAHFHFISGRIPREIRVFDLMDMWYLLGGIGRIYPFEKDKGAEFYMSKSTYAWKRGEIDLSPNLPQLTLTR